MAQLVFGNSVDSQAHIKANGRGRWRIDYSFEYTVCQLGTHGVDGTPLPIPACTWVVPSTDGFPTEVDCKFRVFCRWNERLNVMSRRVSKASSGVWLHNSSGVSNPSG